MKKRALFLDRDGVINKEKNYVHKVEDFHFIDGVFETCKAFQDADYLIVVITNQSGIGRGYYSEDDYKTLTEWMKGEFKKRGVTIAGDYFCPHHPEEAQGDYKTICSCRKPAPGMILKASEELGIDLARSSLVGDKEIDIEAGLKAGVGRNYLVRSGHDVDYENTGATMVLNSIKDLAEAIDLPGRKIPADKQ
jgi:D-glycero-D-manno-heptose 1,7-bisphosphate phosphatase